MARQMFFKSKYCGVDRIILLGIVSLTIFSCSPQIHIVSKKSYPAREENDSVVIYKRLQDIPIKSEKIGTLEAICNLGMKDCDSASILLLTETKIKKAGGNALLITDYQKPTLWNNFKLSLNGDVFLVSDFSSPPDTLSDKFDNRMEKQMLYVGFGAGPETGISFFLPKFSYYNFQNRKFLSTYYGIEGSLWLIEQAWMSLDCLYGIKKNVFTFDASIGVWWHPKHVYEETLGPHFHSTINPKIGVKFWKIWLKGGPSVFLYKNYPKNQAEFGPTNIVKIGRTLCNFEILISLAY